MALSLAHGQVDVEHGFSVNKLILENRTVLNEEALRGMRTVKEVMNNNQYSYHSQVDFIISKCIQDI